MSRSLRHPIKGPRHYPRPGKDRSPQRKPARQPKLHQSRFSVGAMLDAPDTTAARPGLRLRITGLIVAGLFGLLGLRLWTLQVLQAPAAAHAVSANQIRAVAVDPTRGLILDRYGNPLVNNVPIEQITLSRVAAQQYPDVVGRLAALIGQTPAQINASILDPRNSIYKPVPVLANAPLQDILYIREHQDEFPGVASVATTQRNYPQLEMAGPAQNGYPAAQTLGYVSTINAAELQSRASQGYQAGDAFGQSGLEYQYESELRGTPGQQQLEVDAKGRVAGTLKSTPATPGANVVTNLDTNLQQVADNALATQIRTLRNTIDPSCLNAAGAKVGCYPQATEGAVVVMSPQTGAVYAMSSSPTYNLKEWVGGLSAVQNAQLFGPTSLQPTLNRAIQGTYTPGSTFKLNTATAALNTGLITPGFSYYDNGTFKTPDCQYNSTTCVFHDAPGDPTGSYNISSALSVSSDDFFYNLGYLFYSKSAQFGQTPIQDQAAQYSLGQLTGIDLPQEYQGRVDSQAERVKLHAMNPKAFPNTSWYTGENIEMAFGQGGTYITPIEQAVAYSTFANGGTRYAPQVAAAIVSPSGQVVKRFTPQVTGHVNISPTNHQAMLAGFTGVVTSANGTAHGVPGLASFPGGVAGKTGTADTQVGKEPTAWFVGFGPTADPQYVVVCVIDQAGYGATAAAPVVGQIFDYLAGHPVTAPGIPPDPAVIQSQKPVDVPSSTTTTTTTTTTPGATSATSSPTGGTSTGP
ncbi:MAG: penicillin-binding protein 2 [Acidimicrobiales bacterium]|nr:penicillin-binding protein 2 [Acidimicrobiales bacterium]